MRFDTRLMVSSAPLMALLLTGCETTRGAEAPKAPEPQAASPGKPTGPHWGYEASNGPDRWASLSADWALCGTGKSQSPIDLGKTTKAALPAVKAEFKPAELRIIHQEHVADVINNGHSIQVNYMLGDKLKVGSEEFELLQYHFHSPSEHTVGGKHYPIEMHMVHKSAAGKLAVVGVFVEEGQTNPAFEPIWANLPKSKGVELHLAHVTVDVNKLLPAKTESYRYSGSLTTPPCSEGVTWIVMSTPVQMSATQIGAFRTVMSGNNRPPQPLNSREVVTDRIAETSAK